MKKLIIAAGIILSTAAYSGCKQHDPNGPDTGGGVPVDQRSEGGSANKAATEGNPVNPNGNNMTTNATNNNDQIRTGDSSLNKQQKQ